MFKASLLGNYVLTKVFLRLKFSEKGSQKQIFQWDLLMSVKRSGLLNKINFRQVGFIGKRKKEILHFVVEHMRWN